MPLAAAPPIMLDGLFAGSRVETPDGWRRVERLRPGDRVTAAGGPATVLAVEEGTFTRLPLRPALWPLHVPAGALGNGEPVALTPWQAVPDPAPSGSPAHRAGDARAAAQGGRIPAAVLAPWRGIARFRPPPAARVLRLVFARTEVVAVGYGLRIVCLGLDARGGPEGAPPDLGQDAAACVIARLVAQDLGPFLLAPA